MNSFGRLLRVHIFGESHGECVGITIDGVPAGLPLSAEDLLPDLERRKGGLQKGTTPRKEDDYPLFKSGLFNGKTTGFPITILFENNNTRSEDYNKQRSIPRPGHADWVAHQKFGGHEDYRGGGHFSARLTTGLVAAGAIAKKMLRNLTPNPSPKERGVAFGEGYITNNADSYQYVKAFAKQNRLNATPAEQKLWEALRNRKLEGAKFRRQHPIGGFIPDFVCLEYKLIIEVDGEYHNALEQEQYDLARTQWLNENQEFQVLRFNNITVLNDIEQVLSSIKEALFQQLQLAQKGAGNPPSPLEREMEGEVAIVASITHVGGLDSIDDGLQAAIDAKDSVGGIIECRVSNMPVGLGEPYFDSLESQLAHIMFAIPAVKGIEFGSGFAAAAMFGSQHNDAIENSEGKTTTNHAGGIVGGISNGNELVFRIAIKPTSSTPKQQTSLNWQTGEQETFSVKGRHDLCVALRAPVIVEAATALVLADMLLLEQRIPRVIS